MSSTAEITEPITGRLTAAIVGEAGVSTDTLAILTEGDVIIQTEDGQNLDQG